MRIFLDTNVLLDVYLKRAGEPDRSRVTAACVLPRNERFLAVHTLSNAFTSSKANRPARTHGISSVMYWLGPQWPK